MSKIGNYRVGLQETPAYRWGWEWAELGMELQPWLLAHLGSEQAQAAQIGFDDYRNEQVLP